ncbi:MAG TPA: GntR family transcriptional regulator [Advenella kashmirensis]|uniref:GntR family transcriptional regulator n=1 Tax=Advenella kashmirensis TaxID=310575 RepID=A0A356LIT5_9BURK|nr:GntR family transcriptional regulator [Advenella kashmirensis]
MTNTSLAKIAYQQLKEELDNFHYVPGDRFSETEVSTRLGTSRTPVREALLRLQREGYISVMPKLGWIVNTIDFVMFEQLYDVRSVLECAAVDLLCESKNLEQLLQPLCAIWRVDPSERLTDYSQVSKQDESFHITLVHASGNVEMARIHQDITDRIRVVRRLEFTRDYRIDAAYTEHCQMLEALLTRDATYTKTILRKHIAVSRDEVKKITLHSLEAARYQKQPVPH